MNTHQRVRATPTCCPTCGEELRYCGYSTKARDTRWWCPRCQANWMHRTIRELMLHVLDRLDDQREEESGGD